MGCILSYFEKEDKEQSLLVTTPRCFVCGAVFSNMTVYNKHIVHCNLLYQKKPLENNTVF